MSSTDTVFHDVEPGMRARQPLLLTSHAHLTSFIGRETEIAWIRDRLAAGQRLITISGPGGVGKTRLAYAVADSIRTLNRFADGCAIIPLASLAEGHLVIPTIARALGVSVENEQRPVERLATALHNRQMLLVLDNFEQLIGAGVDLRELLDACPGLAMLVTSRRALRLTGEQEFALAPFPIPVLETGAPIEALASSASIALFVDRATAVLPTFALTPENTASVIEICARLDGLPLAIELAAPRIKMLSPQALAARLTGRLQLLVAGPRDAPARQQTLRETLAWSYDLLAPEERQLFRRMSVFAGGATLDAIEAVVSLGGAETSLDLLERIAGLLDQSMLVRDDTASGEPRFRMLETIREYGLHQLDQHGEAETVRDAHAAYFLSIARRGSGSPYGPEESALVKRLDPEVDNVRAALTWLLIEHPGDTVRARQGLWLAGAMGRFWDLRGYVNELETWLKLGLARFPMNLLQSGALRTTR